MRKRILMMLFTSIIILFPTTLNASVWEETAVEPIFTIDTPSGSFYDKNIDHFSSFDNPISRALGDDEEDDFETGGGENPEDGYNDAPISDGSLVFILCIAFYISIIWMRLLDKNRKIKHQSLES
ncbi:hypothetical protein LJB98_01625 [Bacteroidales bacterium OttesenSCG-928-M11]|nr:hypothetical protein [Bacteroidales bacterium OttesenSCG-928-M11]